MKIKQLFVLACAFILLFSCKSEDSIDSYLGFDAIPKEALDQYLNDKMKEYDIPGMSIAFINDGEVVYHSTKGYAFREKKIPVTKSTIFEGASMSKSVFAYFVMKYVDEGKLDLDKPLYEYLPYEDIAHDERYKKITARMVLSHRTGFPNWREDRADDKLVINFEPGTDFMYSGEGYMYLSKVLKEIDQTDWEGLEAIFQQKVAQPLGMEHTVFLQDDYARANRAEPYDKKGVWISPERDWDSIYRRQFRAPASIHSEPLDFSKWLIALTKNEGLSEESFKELYTVHSYVDEYDGIKVDYTLGFFKPRIPLFNIYGHGGNNIGFTCSFSIDPEKGWGYVLFTNSEYGEQLGNELLLYSMTGPKMTNLYIFLGFLAVVVPLLVFVLIRWIIRKMKKK
jgi:CubicO group peptidase (beta-lactamase class C family)